MAIVDAHTDVLTDEVIVPGKKKPNYTKFLPPPDEFDPETECGLYGEKQVVGGRVLPRNPAD